MFPETFVLDPNPKNAARTVMVTQHVPFALQSTIQTSHLSFHSYFAGLSSIIYIHTSIMTSTPVPSPPPSLDPVTSIPNIETETNPEITQPDAQAQTDKDNAPIPKYTTSDPLKSAEPATPGQVKHALPQVIEGEEKHDWEVVNASPSHSPSKDVVNSNIDTSIKGRVREREKSNNSTFGKEGKIGQKLDGVKKVLKSGVFGELPCPIC